ncbi:MAG: hypothetical protein ACREQ5_01045 [Candidatus Dormibacteria bacterium]
MDDSQRLAAICKVWTDHGYVAGPSGVAVAPEYLERMAELAAHALRPLCGATHPHREGLVCTNQNDDGVWHRNDQLGVDWTNDGVTEHDELGRIALLDLDRHEDTTQHVTWNDNVVASSAPTPEPVTDNGPVPRSVVDAILDLVDAARGTLDEVSHAYRTKCGFNAALCRKAENRRDACAEAVRTVRELLEENEGE